MGGDGLVLFGCPGSFFWGRSEMHRQVCRRYEALSLNPCSLSINQNLFLFFFLTVILPHCAAEHVNCSVASFQRGDFTVQMSGSTWQ